MNGSPATKRPRDHSPSPRRPSKRQCPPTETEANTPTLLQSVGGAVQALGNSTVNSYHSFVEMLSAFTAGINRQPAGNSSASRRARRSSRRRSSVPNTSNGVITIDDSDDEADERDAAVEQQRRSNQEAARLHLNDHVPNGSPEQRLHTFLSEDLFPTSFRTGLASSPSAKPAAAALATPLPSATWRPHPDTTDRPRRVYGWEQRSQSPASSSSDRSSRSRKRSPKQRSPKHTRNLRGAEDTTQRSLIQGFRHQLELSGQKEGLETWRRVEAEMEEDRKRRSNKTKKIHRPPSIARADRSNRVLESFTPDLRKTLDEASASVKPQAVPRPAIRARYAPTWDSLYSPLHNQQKIQKTIANEKIKQHLARTPSIPDKLSAEQEQIVTRTLRDRSFKIDIGTDCISYTSIARLKPGEWLNDEVVNCYAQLINQRSKKDGLKVHCWSSYFYEKLSTDGYAGANMKRWTKRLKLDIFSLDKMLIPINLGNVHWVCALVDFTRQRIEYYDSMEDSGRRASVFQNIRDYLQAEHKEKKGGALDLSAWADAYSSSTPRQDNGSDCGIFSCQTLEMASRGRDLVDGKFEFNQSNIPLFRRLMIVELASGELAQRPWALR